MRIFILTIIAMALLFTQSAAAEVNYKVQEVQGGLVITCVADDCVVESIVIDRGKKIGSTMVELGNGVEFQNFGRKTHEEVVLDPLWGFELDLATGEITRLECRGSKQHVAIMRLAKAAGKKVNDTCTVTNNTFIRLEFSHQIAIRVSNPLEVNINNGELVLSK